MKKIFTIFTIFLFLANNTIAQITFEKKFSLQTASVGKSVKQTFDGGYVVAGTIVTKTTDSGNVDWIYYNPADYVNTTADSGYILIRNTGDIFFTKLNKLGDTVWTSSYSAGLWAREGNSIKQTSDGGFIVAGRFQDFSGSGMMLLKLNALGGVSWKKTWWEPTSAAFAYGQEAHQTSDGGYIMAGHTYIDYYDSNRHKDIMVVKTDSAGNQQWIKYFGGTADEYGYSVQETTNNGYIVAGNQYDSISSGTNMYLIRLNSLGDTLWTKTYGGTFDSGFKSVGLTTDGGYILTGSSNISSSGGPTNVSVYKVDSTGNILWTKEFGAADADVGNEILQTTDGGYVLTGLANSNTSFNGVMWLIKMDSLGNVSAPLSISQSQLLQANIKVYPNPTSGQLFIETELQNSSFHIYNLEGKKVYSQKLTMGANTLQIESLAKGTYLYQVSRGPNAVKQAMFSLK